MEAARPAAWAVIITALHCALTAGCSSVPCGCDRDCLAEDLAVRTDHTLGPAACSGQIVLPNGAVVEDGLLEDEAVLIALWNNAAFQELLTEVGIAQGDLVQAGLLPNPEVVYFFPVTDKPYKYALDCRSKPSGSGRFASPPRKPSRIASANACRRPAWT